MSTRAWATILVIVVGLIVVSLVFLQTVNPPRPTTYAEIGPELGSGRIERTEQGFAVTTPEGWTAWAPAASFQDWWGSDRVVQLWMEPAAESETWWMSACGIGDECTRERMVEAGGEAYCWILEDTELAEELGWSGPDDPMGLTVETAEREEWTDVRTATEELPAGTAGVFEAIDPNGWEQSIRYVTDGERWLRLLCGVLDSDVEADSIARTLEFLDPQA